MFVGYLHVRRLLACSSATCKSVGYSTYMCQFSFNIKATLFVCSSLALNLLTTRLVDLASFPNSFSRPFRLGPSLSNSRLPSFARVAPYNDPDPAGFSSGSVQAWEIPEI